MATGECWAPLRPDRADYGSSPADHRPPAVKQPTVGTCSTANKIFITNGTIAGVRMFIWLAPAVRCRGISAFLVP
jgi:alkylation response protein AidB-like acyl-CoA dehydrogenase